jgi:HK97 family phage major capsid protein
VPGQYTDLITRADAAGLIPTPEVIEIQNLLNQQSIALSLMRQVPMSSGQAKMSVLDALPHAYWVNGDTGLKQTTKISWDGKLLTAEELAVIVPIPEAVIADSSRDIFAEVRPLLAREFAAKLDQATVFALDRPASFSPAILTGATTAGQVEGGTAPDNIDAALATLEALDVNVGAIAARSTVRGGVRKALQGLGGAVAFGGAPTDLFGYPLTYPAGTVSWPAAVDAIMGDWSAAILGVRQDITYRIITEGVITDDTGTVLFNLPQQDSVALRAVARYAFATADYLYRDAAGADQVAYPFAVASNVVGP